MTAREHCRSPHACAAKGTGLCRPCVGRRQIARINNDPTLLALRQARSNTSKTTEDYRMAMRAHLRRLRSKRKFAEAATEAARRSMAALNADPDIIARRGRAVSVTKTRLYAERVGVPLSLISDFRHLRSRKFPLSEARAILAQSHQDEFARMVRERTPGAEPRPIGPQPAPGTPERREWIRKATEARP